MKINVVSLGCVSFFRPQKIRKIDISPFWVSFLTDAIYLPTGFRIPLHLSIHYHWPSDQPTSFHPSLLFSGFLLYYKGDYQTAPSSQRTTL